ncbi:hypothetical protein DH86_00002425, partial [Scytalidium sp. 3C]
NEYDFDSPEAIDFDVLIERLRDLKAGKRAEIPIYSFAKHAREKETTSIYSPHVLILEGIFALYDPRVLELLDMRIFCEADADTCLSRRILRDVEERGRDIEGCIKQWFAFVKPNFERYVEPQRKVTGASPITAYVSVLEQTPQVKGMSTIIQDIDTDPEEFVFYFDRMTTLLVEHSVLLLDPQMSSGGAALMTVQVLLDHGVAEERIVFVTYFAGKMGLNRLTKVFPKIRVVVCKVVGDSEERWLEKRYFRC